MCFANIYIQYSLTKYGFFGVLHKSSKHFLISSFFPPVEGDTPPCPTPARYFVPRKTKKWPEMRSKVNFGHPKLAPLAILYKISKIKIPYWSKMGRNAIKSIFLTSKKMIKSEFRTPKWPPASHFVKNLKKNKIMFWSKMARNVEHPKWVLAAI